MKKFKEDDLVTGFKECSPSKSRVSPEIFL